MHYYEVVPGTVRICKVAYSTDWRNALPANFFHFPQRKFGKKAVTKFAFHAGKWFSKCLMHVPPPLQYIASYSYVIHIIDETVHLIIIITNLIEYASVLFKNN